jgi:hypothetical protein
VGKASRMYWVRTFPSGSRKRGSVMKMVIFTRLGKPAPAAVEGFAQVLEHLDCLSGDVAASDDLASFVLGHLSGDIDRIPRFYDVSVDG